ncbi:carbohydrate-binding protein [Aquimarina sp. MMG016]|uniref:carbohydrate-binding protein n=1 Tax=Aquimarina sp. MMG016 TaxID=2822690 RepID=UPI001B3A1523|nr:carbohydrate-binding protein [Aquimarina sp. MMG016]MBQ4818753.1 hypothetical protein [Aquimarina sp. MMG016]
MKKYLFLLLSLVIFSCTTEDDFITNQEEATIDQVSAKSTNAVSLIKTYNSYSFYRGFNTWRREFTVRVANIGFEKNVSIYHEKVDGSWEEIPLTYSLSVDDQAEIWTGKYEYTGYTADKIYDDEFVVKYEVNGTTYWDNNNNENYVVGEKEVGYLFTQPDLNISVDSASLYPHYTGGNSFNLIVDVRNIDPSKEVEVAYTTDGWQTIQYLPLNFTARYYSGYQYVLVSPNQFGIERWTGSTIVDSSIDTIEYAVVYRVNGQEYWDNNYNNNYTVHKTN